MIQKAAIYCRVSTRDQSCDRQERDLLVFAERAGYEIIGIWKETGSGARHDRQERKKIMSLAQRREIDIVLVTELTRWGRSVPDLVDTLGSLHTWGISVIAQTGFQIDLSTPQGRLVAGIMFQLAEFERELLRERTRSGIAAAKARGKVWGREQGFTPTCDRVAKRVVALRAEGRSLRWIARDLQICVNTVRKTLEKSEKT